MRWVVLVLCVLAASAGAGEGEDSVARVRGDLRASPPRTATDYRSFLDRLARIRGEEAKAERLVLLHEYLEGPGADDAAARESVGYVNFSRLERAVAPEPTPAIEDLLEPGRRLTLVESLPVLSEERWLTDPVDVATALEALRAFDREARRRASDPLFRLGVRAEANLATEPEYGSFLRATRWSPPWLVVVLGRERVTPYDLLKAAVPLRAERLRRGAAHLEASRPVLADHERLLSALTEELTARFGERLRLRPLASPFGGAPDAPPGRRSFPDGVAIPVIVFPDATSFREHDGAWLPYLDLTTGRAVLYVEPYEVDREMEHVALLQSATKALLYWWTRQRNPWKVPGTMKSWLSDGVARWMSGVRRDGDGIRFTGVPRTLLRAMQKTASVLGKPANVAEDEVFQPPVPSYPLWPLEKLTSSLRSTEAAAWATGEWSVDDWTGRELYYEQAWALIVFLDEFEGGKYRDRLADLLDRWLDRESPDPAFRRVMGIRDSGDWLRLDEEFRRFVLDDLLRRDPEAYAPDLPMRPR